MEATSRGEYTEQTKKATDLKDDVITISDDEENVEDKSHAAKVTTTDLNVEDGRDFTQYQSHATLVR